MEVYMYNCKYDVADASAVLSVEGMTIRVTACTDSIFRVTRTANPNFSDRDYNIITDDGKKLHTAAEIAENASTISLSTSKMKVSINKTSGTIDFSDAEGNIYMSENVPCVLSKIDVYKNIWGRDSTISEGKNVDGARAYADGCSHVFDRTAYVGSYPLSFRDDEGIFGFGSYEEGYGNLRGKVRYIYQENMRAVVPMMISTYGYGILFNCGCSMIFDDAEKKTLTFDCVDEIDCYFIGGGSHRAVMEGYYSLTGKPPMMPKYLFGYTQSKEHYASSDELISIVAEYRRRKIPLDIIVQDWQSWEDGQWGQKSFDPARYPDPSEMTGTLHGMNARLMLSIWPIMTGKSENRAEMLERDLMLGNQANYDSFNAEARALYWEQTKRGLFDFGVDCWWCDCSEPFEADWCGETKPAPESERYLLNTNAAKKYIECDKINLYSLYHSKGIYEGMRGCSDKRVANLTRSSYAGQHRYSTITWSGDVTAKWSTLERHISEGVNFTCTGEPYWAFDTGAFFVSKRSQWFWDGDYDGGADDLGYRELYVRWLEYGAFTPMLRSHGTDTPREIWRFGEAGTPFYDAIEKAIRLRYSLVPYIYSLAADVTFRAGAIMNPLALVFPNDKKCFDITTQYMFGDIMVCPVTKPMYYTVNSAPVENAEKSRTVYIPDGMWYDYHTTEKIIGGREIIADAPLDKIPLYVSAGAIIITAPVMQYTDEIKNPVFTVTIFTGADGEFTLYNDDSETYAYERGEYEQIKIIWDDNKRILTIRKRDGTYRNMPQSRNFELKTSDGTEISVVYSGNEISVQL